MLTVKKGEMKSLFSGFQSHQFNSDTNRDRSMCVIIPTISIGSLWLMGIPLLSSVLLTGVVGVLIAFGATACRWAGLKKVGTGVGLVVGSGFLVLLGQLLLLFEIPALLVHITVILGMAILSILGQKNAWHRLVQAQSNPNREILFCLAISLLVLAVRHPWLWYFAVPVVALERFTSRGVSRNQNYVTLLLLSCGFGLVLSKQFQPTHWWYYYQGNDSQFFEAVGFTLSEWGIFENPGDPGGSVAAYHWLAYAFFGQLSRLANLDVWHALMKVGPLIIPFATTGVLSARSPKAKDYQFALVLFGSLGLQSFRTDSFAFSIPVAFATLYLVERFATEKVESLAKEFFFLMFLFTTLIFAKTTTAVVVFVILALWSLSTVRTSRLRQHLPLLILGLTGTIWYLLLFRQHPSTPNYDFDLQNAGVRLTSRLADPQFGFQSLLYAVVLTQIFLSGRHERKMHRLVYAAVTACLVSIGVAIFITGPQIHYWFLTGPLIAVFIAISYAQVGSSESFLTNPVKVWVMLPILFGVTLAKFWGRLLHAVHQFFGQGISDFQWEIVQNNGLVVLSVTICIALAFLLHKRSHLWFLGVVPLLALVFGFTLENGRQGYASLDVHRFGSYVLENPGGGNSAPFAGSDLQQVARYIRDNTSSEAILASNNFCCEGDEWWLFSKSSILENYSEISSNLGAEWTGGANYLLPAYARRRFFMQGLGFQVPLYPLTERQVARMTLSLEFANDPNIETVRVMRANGVSGFVVNLSLTAHRDWSKFATERFRSGNFVYLEF